MVSVEEEEIVNDRKTYGTYTLPCGHEGIIVYKRKHIIGVEGVRRSCLVCGKWDRKGEWTPTTYLIKP